MLEMQKGKKEYKYNKRILCSFSILNFCFYHDPLKWKIKDNMIAALFYLVFLSFHDALVMSIIHQVYDWIFKSSFSHQDWLPYGKEASTHEEITEKIKMSIRMELLTLELKLHVGAVWSPMSEVPCYSSWRFMLACLFGYLRLKLYSKLSCLLNYKL